MVAALAQQIQLGSANSSTTSPPDPFIVISRQRSATTTFTALLAQHPQIYPMSEILNVGWATKQMPRALVQLIHERLPNVTTHSELIEHVPAVVRLTWSWCDGGPDERRRDGGLHCGFKVFEEHLRPERQQHHLELLPPPPGPGGGSQGGNGTSGDGKTPLVAQLLRLYRASPGVTPLTIVLERRNVSAEYESWRTAVTTHDWGTTPAAHHAHQMALQAKQDKGSGGAAQPQPPPLAATTQGPTPSLAHFAHEHALWFARARATARHAGSRVLEMTTEALLDSPARELARVEAFLGVAPHAQYTMPSTRKVKKDKGHSE